QVSTCLLVKQLPFSVTKDRLKKTFMKSVSARIVLNPETKISRGFGFVEFENEKDATDAMNAMQGRDLDGRKMVISAALKK
ncbi:hypothetical protein HELRODRAFT_137856, partial [Helobdella robusta]|uniref:RRM domain-containing protein n=1 Tax=Helobdella robusta TaxID=6412 RepID=T1EIP3_HELRO